MKKYHTTSVLSLLLLTLSACAVPLYAHAQSGTYFDPIHVQIEPDIFDSYIQQTKTRWQVDSLNNSLQGIQNSINSLNKPILLSDSTATTHTAPVRAPVASLAVTTPSMSNDRASHALIRLNRACVDIPHQCNSFSRCSEQIQPQLPGGKPIVPYMVRISVRTAMGRVDMSDRLLHRRLMPL